MSRNIGHAYDMILPGGVRMRIAMQRLLRNHLVDQSVVPYGCVDFKLSRDVGHAVDSRSSFVMRFRVSSIL